MIQIINKLIKRGATEFDYSELPDLIKKSFKNTWYDKGSK